jgi:ABC-type uncharacterized transport system involved in gliding motility auxiliary subunit
MESLRRYGGAAGAVMALSGGGIIFMAPDLLLYGQILLGIGLALILVAAFMNRSDLASVLKGRPFRYGANAIFYSLMVLLVVAAVNLLAARHNRRFDLTEGELYSLSPQTVKILEALDQDVTVIGFYSSQFSGGRQLAEDLLEEYGYHSDRINVRLLDPRRSPGEVRAYGVETDGTIIVSAATGEARVTEATEEALTNAFIKAIARTKKVICTTTGHGEKGIEDDGPDGFGRAADALRMENFEVREIRLLEGSQAINGCDSVIVPGPTHSMVTTEAEALESFLEGGGRVLVMREPRAASGLEPLLEQYGLKVGDDFIVDVNPVGRLLGGSPAAPVVYDYGDHEITRELEGLATIYPTAVSVRTVTPEDPGIRTYSLAQTSEQSWGEMGELTDEVGFDEGTDRMGPLSLAAAAVRTLDDESQDVPSRDPGGEETAAGDEEEGETVERQSRIVCFGDSDYAGNGAFLLAGNRDLFLNTIAWLNQRSDLISIRPKERVPEPIVLTAIQARLLYVWWLAGPIIAMLAGIAVHVRRKRL